MTRETASISDLPYAVDRLDDIRRTIGGRNVAVFLDYDGTLTPIVDDPDAAVLEETTARTLEVLGRRCPVAVVSGRDLDDVRARVGLDDVYYAGSHGFDLLEPDGRRHAQPDARGARGELDSAEEQLRDRLRGVEGVIVERKRYGVAVHYRRVPRGEVEAVLGAVQQVASAHQHLQVGAGKQVRDLRPDVEWDKGAALRWILDQEPDPPGGVVAVYAGDDVTDEDAFREVREQGIGLVVEGEEDRPTRAHYRVRDPAEMQQVLAAVAAMLAPDGEAPS